MVNKSKYLVKGVRFFKNLINHYGIIASFKIATFLHVLYIKWIIYVFILAITLYTILITHFVK